MLNNQSVTLRHNEFCWYQHFLQKITIFGQDNTFTQSSSVRAVLEFFSFVFSFCKVTINENVGFTNDASGIRLLDCSKLVVNWKNGNDLTIFWSNVIVNIFWGCFVSSVNFSYWSKFHVNIITGSGQFPFIKDWPEIWNCPISRDWGELGIPNLARTSLIKCY